MKTFTVYWWNAEGTKRLRRDVKAKTTRKAALLIIAEETTHLDAGIDVEPRRRGGGPPF